MLKHNVKSDIIKKLFLCCLPILATEQIILHSLNDASLSLHIPVKHQNSLIILICQLKKHTFSRFKIITDLHYIYFNIMQYSNLKTAMFSFEILKGAITCTITDIKALR